MAVFRLQVFNQIGEGAKWTNVYHIRASNLAATIDAFSTDMKAHLLEMLHASARIVRVLASDPLTDAFSEISVEEFGTSSFTDSLLPLFNCVKVSIGTAASGRPDVKFMKGWVTEESSDSGVVDPTALGNFINEFNSMIDDMSGDATPLVSDTNDAWGTATGQPAVQMRQLHRKRKKPTP